MLRLQVNKDFSDFGIKFLATSSYSIIDLPTAIIFLRCCDSQECSSNGDTYMSRPVQHRLQRKPNREFQFFNANSRCVALLSEPNVEYPFLAEGYIRPLKVNTAEDNPTFELYSALLDDDQ